MGLVEGKDFSLATDSFTMLEQSRMVNQVVHHDLVPATYDINQQGSILTAEIPSWDEEVITHHDLVPAVMDGETEVSPEVPAWDETTIVNHPLVAATYDPQGLLITTEVPAWDENVYTTELYTLTAPTLEEMNPFWYQVQVDESDISLLALEYLRGKDNLRTPEDSIELRPLYKQSIDNWHFPNIPKPTIEELAALIAPMSERINKETLIADKQSQGAIAREKCTKALDVVAGYNLSLTSEQIDSMVVTFASIFTELKNNRPGKALPLVQAVNVDGVLVTQEMKDIIVSILT